MSKHVLILGAGASREAGGPLMSDFLDRAEDLSRSNNHAIDRAAFTLVFEAIAELDRVHAKGILDTLNVESVFGAFEMASLLGRLGAFEDAKLQTIKKAITTLIVQTVEQQVRFPIVEGKMRPPPSYDALALLLEKRFARTPEQVALITFNYDAALDHALYFHHFGINYSLETTANPHVQAVDLLKLHGSVNWTDRDGRQIAAMQMKDFFARFRVEPRDDEKDSPLPLSANISVEGSCSGIPFIVPPTWSKFGHYDQIATVWRRAAQHLAEAEHVYVFGYSLPEADAFFRLLYAVGSIGKTRLRDFLVFDPAPEVASRFERLLGPTARVRFHAEQLKFSAALSSERFLRTFKAS